MLYNPRSPLSLLHTLAVLLPLLIAVMYGVVLCLRHRHRKPQTVIHHGTAIALLLASAAPTIVVSIVFWLGFRLTRDSTSALYVILLMQSALLAMGLVLLFRAGHLDQTPREYDPTPPVYRNDDGPAEEE